MSDHRGYVAALAAAAETRLRSGEVLTTYAIGEDSDFVRFNGGDVRQAGSVQQLSLTLELIHGRRHASATVQLGREQVTDRGRVDAAVTGLREQLQVMPDDPFLSYATHGASTERSGDDTVPEPAAAIADIRDAAAGTDLVGVYAAGRQFCGFTSSLGQRNWHERGTYAVDWSLHLRSDKAAKGLYAGSVWDPEVLTDRIDWTRRQLDVLGRPPVRLRPDGYRAYLAPAAVRELTDLVSWGGFGLRAQRTTSSPLLRMVTEGAELHPSITIREATAHGVGPAFQEQGFLRPDAVVLVDGGRYADTLVSPRSAAEYGAVTNGASADEVPASLRLDPGDLPTDGVLDALDTGLYVGNLWYLNFSDRAACRATGMTRFATFWVDGGEIVAPVEALRFDDTAYHLFGDRLVGLTDTTELLLDSSSYDRRSTGSTDVPGVLVGEMRFTL